MFINKTKAKNPNPMNIGLVTPQNPESESDIIRNINRRYPNANIITLHCEQTSTGAFCEFIIQNAINECAVSEWVDIVSNDSDFRRETLFNMFEPFGVKIYGFISVSKEDEKND